MGAGIDPFFFFFCGKMGFDHWELKKKSPWCEWDLHYQRLSGIIKFSTSDNAFRVL